MRHWIKVRLQDNELASYAFNVVEKWRVDRIAAINLVKAVALFYTLSNGDTSLLKKYFPLLGEVRNSMPIEAPVIQSQTNKTPKTRTVEKTADDDLDDFLESMGIE